MKSITAKQVCSTVKGLVATVGFVVSAVGLMPEISSAAEGATDARPATASAYPGYPPQRDKNRCEDLESKANESLSEQRTACREAGLDVSVSSCVKRYNACSTDAETSQQDGAQYQAMQQMMTGFGLPATSLSAITGLGSGGKCPKYSHDDYFRRKEELDRQIKEANDDINDQNEKVTEAQEEYNRISEEAQQTLSDINKTYNEVKKDLRQDERDRMEEAMKTSRETAEARSKLVNESIPNARIALNSRERKYQTELANYSSQMNKLACMDQVKKLRDELDKLGLFKSSSTSRAIPNAKEKKESLQNKFNMCMSSLKKQLLDLQAERREYLESAQRGIDMLQEQLASLDKSAEEAAANLTKVIADIKTQNTEADAQKLTDMQNNSTKIQNAYSVMQTKQTAIQAQIGKLQQRISQLTTDLMNLGPEPPPSAERSFGSTTDKLYEAQEALLAYKASCCGSNTPERGSHNKSLCGQAEASGKTRLRGTGTR